MIFSHFALLQIRRRLVGKIQHNKYSDFLTNLLVRLVRKLDEQRCCILRCLFVPAEHAKLSNASSCLCQHANHLKLCCHRLHYVTRIPSEVSDFIKIE